jgi:hypothetical protein
MPCRASARYPAQPSTPQGPDHVNVLLFFGMSLTVSSKFTISVASAWFWIYTNWRIGIYRSVHITAETKWLPARLWFQVSECFEPPGLSIRSPILWLRMEDSARDEPPDETADGLSPHAQRITCTHQQASANLNRPHILGRNSPDDAGNVQMIENART